MAKGFILDGFPRTVSQAGSLHEILADRGEDLDAVVEMQVPEDLLVERLLARGRADDTEDVIRRRQQVYRDETAPLLDHYRDRLVTRGRGGQRRGDHRPGGRRPAVAVSAVDDAR